MWVTESSTICLIYSVDHCMSTLTTTTGNLLCNLPNNKIIYSSPSQALYIA